MTQKDKKKLRIVLIILISVIMSTVYYRMFFSQFDLKSIQEHQVVLVANPEYHSGGVRQSSSWWFKTKNETFELDNINPTDISKKEIYQLKKGDSVIFYSYHYYSIPGFFQNLNGRTIIMGLKSKQFNKYDLTKIKNHIIDMDQKVFWSLNFFITFIIIASYFDRRNKQQK